MYIPNIFSYTKNGEQVIFDTPAPADKRHSGGKI
jgi:hypothetical protein